MSQLFLWKIAKLFGTSYISVYRDCMIDCRIDNSDDDCDDESSIRIMNDNV